jgi:DNA-directed RNA polymerase specialized sigma24 family protein
MRTINLSQHIVDNYAKYSKAAKGIMRDTARGEDSLQHLLLLSLESGVLTENPNSYFNTSMHNFYKRQFNKQKREVLVDEFEDDTNYQDYLAHINETDASKDKTKFLQDWLEDIKLRKPMQYEVISLVLSGLTVPEIAKLRNRSYESTKTHYRNAIQCMKVRSLNEKYK